MLRISFTCLLIIVLPILCFAQSDIIGLDSSMVLKSDPNFLAKNYLHQPIGISAAPSLLTMMNDAFPGYDISGAGSLLMTGFSYGFLFKEHIHFEPKVKVAFTKIKKVNESYGITEETGWLVFSIGAGARYTVKTYAPSFYATSELRLDFPTGLEDVEMKSKLVGIGFGVGYIFSRTLFEVELGYSTLLVQATSDTFSEKTYNMGGIYFSLGVPW